MTKIYSSYIGGGQTVLEHGPTENKITTDLPPDNGGLGRAFSPTDLFAGAMASCALTIMGKLAENRGKDISGASIEIEKIMADNPRRVSKFIMKIIFPAGVGEEERKVYLASVRACPVHNSISKGVVLEIIA
jgi:uncharacterized OsmC-like protein